MGFQAAAKALRERALSRWTKVQLPLLKQGAPARAGGTPLGAVRLCKIGETSADWLKLRLAETKATVPCYNCIW